MSNTSKVLVDQKGGNNLLYLPLDKLMQMTAPTATLADSGGKPAESVPGSEPLPSASRSREALRGREREPR